jgi:uncharacterized protein
MPQNQYTHGRFVWRELVTPDAAAAKRFYSELFGWNIRAVEVPGGARETIHAANVPVAGILELAAARGVPPHWNGYVSVSDVDAATRRVVALGGKVVLGPQNLASVGRFASALDPQGGAFSLMTGLRGDLPPAPPRSGEFCWEQVTAQDLPALEAFYTAVLGWTTAPLDARPHVHVFAHGDASKAENQVATATFAPPGVATHWMSHVVVDDLAGTRARAVRLGGEVVAPAVTVPGYGVFAVLRDPQGALFCAFASATRPS